jgi:hypothetical protein
MRDDRDGINRPPGTDPYLNRRPRVFQSPAYGWSIPTGIAALFILAGFLFFNSGGHGPGGTPHKTPSAASGPVVPGAPPPAPNK